MESKEFNLEAIEKTFTRYTKGKVLDGVVVLKRQDGVIFNIGGKNDAFIEKDDFDDFENVKVGERFKVVVLDKKNEDGLLVASKRGAQELIFENQNADKLKLGSSFSFVVTDSQGGLKSRMGDYSIFIPASEVSEKYVSDFKSLIGKRKEAVVTEINREERTIIGSIKMLENQTRVTVEGNFWNSIFINKVVKGKVSRFAPFGAFINVNGVDCLAHNFDLSYEKVEDPSSILNMDEEYTFRVVKVDKEAKRVSLGLKQLQDDPMTEKVKEVEVGENYEGEVIKILAFGAVIKLPNGATGLLHISEVTDNKTRNIYEFMKVGDKREVIVISTDIDSKKISLRLLEGKL